MKNEPGKCVRELIAPIFCGNVGGAGFSFMGPQKEWEDMCFSVDIRLTMHLPWNLYCTVWKKVPYPIAQYLYELRRIQKNEK